MVSCRFKIIRATSVHAASSAPFTFSGSGEMPVLM